MEAQLLVVAISEEGSFLRAAERLQMPQPSLTRKISQLERDLGVRLFERNSRRVNLTAAGRLLIPEAQTALKHAKRGMMLAQQQAVLEHGPFRLGFSAYIHSSLIPALRGISIPQPGMPGITFESVSTTQMVERVLRGTLHAGIGVQPIMDNDLWVKTIGIEPFFICVPRTHRLAAKPTVTIQDLHAEKVFWFPAHAHPHLYRSVEKHLTRSGVRPGFEDVRGAAHVIEMAASGTGLGIVPRSATRLTRTGIQFKPLADKFLRVETALFARRDQRHGSIQELLDAIFSHLQTLRLSIQ
ncbi:MAG: LysR family transcriptional regulator [Acidobacteria bacterium]|nr:LysR family transcriptional regulator [Acidobacteriota bacterium]